MVAVVKAHAGAVDSSPMRIRIVADAFVAKFRNLSPANRLSTYWREFPVLAKSHSAMDSAAESEMVFTLPS